MSKTTIAKPFVKWAGGKAQLIKQYEDLFPFKEELPSNITTYVEPFVGGGAVLFYMLQKYPTLNAVISDSNEALINCYICIKRNPQALIEELRGFQKRYDELKTIDEKEKLYLEIRDAFNLLDVRHPGLLGGKARYLQAACLIFLNKTCFNGLYRVNNRGKFNTPFGKYQEANVCDAENIMRCHELLRRVDIYCGDFQDLSWAIGNDTFVYFDPPYRPLKGKGSFTAYDKSGFTEADQQRLMRFFNSCTQQGALCMLSNSADENDTTLRKLYAENCSNVTISEVEARRNINSKGKERGKIKELVITNYEV